MNHLQRFGVSTLLLLCGLACSAEVVTTSTSDGASTAAGPPPPPGSYVLDFTGCKLGGLRFGSNVNLAFSLDLTQPVRSFAITSLDPQIGPGLNASYDHNKICPLDQLLDDPSIVEHLSAVGPGQLANVSEVEMDIASTGKTPGDTSQGYCFAYRDSTGTWHANSAVANRTYDASTDSFHVLIPIDQVADALYFVTTDSSSALTRLTYKAAAP